MKFHGAVLMVLSNVLFVTMASSQVYEVIDLSRQVGSFSDARAINDSGLVVVNTWTRGYVWKDSAVISLGTLGGSSTLATGINARGDVVGYSSLQGDTMSNAFLWRNGAMVQLPVLPGGRFSSAEAINDSGEIVGYARDAGDSVQRAVLWKDGILNDLGSLGGNSRAAFAINNSRQIAGDAYLADNSTSHGFIWENGTMSDIGTLGGYSTAALDINESGAAVGYSTVNFSETRAFLYQGGTMTDLGPNGYAEGINDAGQVVGWGYNPNGANNHAFLWSQGVLTDLNDVIDPASGWVLNFARDINNKGEIVGVGTRGFESRPFLLVPASILLTNPRSGTLWISGEQDTIRWKSALAPGAAVVLHYSYDDGQTWNILAGNLAADSEKYVWTIPDTIASAARIMITALNDFSKHDTSDAFTLRPYVLSKRSALGQSIAYTPSSDQWSFGNYGIDIWPPGWYKRFDYRGTDSISGKSYLSGGLYASYVFFTAKRSDFPDWPSFANTFTPNSCYTNLSQGVYSPTAVAKWASLKRDWHGSCFGIAIANAIVFRDHSGFGTKYTDFPSFNFPHEIGADMRVIPTVNELFTHQIGNPHASVVNEGKHKTPAQTMRELKEMFLSDDAPVRTLGLIKNHGSGAHEILPYKLRQDPEEKNLYYLNVYDNNNPTGYDVEITIDTAQNGGNGSWDWPEYENWGGAEGFFLMDPAVNYLSNPSLPTNDPGGQPSPLAVAANTVEVTPGCPASIHIRDVQGHETGYFDSLVHAGIPQSQPRLIFNGRTSPPYSYQLPKAAYSVLLNKFSDETSRAFFFTESSTFSIERTGADSGQTDRLFFDGSCSVANPDTLGKSFDLTSILREFTLWQGQYQWLERVFLIQSLAVSRDDSVRMENVGTSGLKLSVFGSGSRTYNLSVELAAYTGSKRFTHASIPLAGNSSHLIRPDWPTLGSGGLKIFIDNGNDGAIDDSLMLLNEVTGVRGRGALPVPGGYRLGQNYPNPFNPRTTIEYDLPKRSHVRMAIYDLFGKEIAVLVDRSEDAGYKSVEWIADGVATGVYFCRLQAGGVTLTRKLVLMR